MSDPGRRYVFTPVRAARPAGKMVALGIVLSLVAHFLSFGLAGAGHGWGAPFFVSMPLLAILPIVLVRSQTGDRPGKAWDVGLVVLAVAADYYLIGNAIDFRQSVGRVPGEYLVPGIHRTMLPFFVLWLGIWLFWQWLAIRTLLRHFHRRAPSAGRQ